MGKRFIVLDGSSLFFRAYYALPPLSDSKGNPTNAILGFSNMLLKLISELHPDFMAVAFDKSRQTFRTRMYPAYKGTRDKTPEDLIKQIPLLRGLTECFGIPFLEMDDYEADDIIGTLSTQTAERGYDVIVITGDRDALQLIRPNLRVFLTKKGISDLGEYDESSFEEEYGIKPIRLIDLKALMGDTSDNIPGVHGIGSVKATQLLKSYGSLEDILGHIDDIKGKKMKETLRLEKDIAILSKALATIKLHVPGICFAEDDFKLAPDKEKVSDFCHTHELRATWKSFASVFNIAEDDGSAVPELQTIDLSYHQWGEGDLGKIGDNIAIGGDFDGKPPFEQLRSLAIALEDGEVGVISCDSPSWSSAVERICKAHCLILPDAKQFYHAGLSFSDDLLDANVCAYLIQPEVNRYEVSDMAARFLSGYVVPEDMQGLEKVVWEARVLLLLKERFEDELKEKSLDELYETIERPLIPILSEMEKTGIFVNRTSLEKESSEVEKKICSLEEEIYRLAGHSFNINSTKQLGGVLFEELGLPVVKKKKTGYSTDAEVLETLRLHHPIVEYILSYRLWKKLKSTYLDGIASLIDAESGRVHTSYNQTVTTTGRLSSSDPNLQNIPVRTEEGRTIRALFEPGPDFDELLSADYSQIELRVLAHMSGDENFIDAFKKGQDIHARTASEVFGVDVEDVTPELRRKAKAVNFGIVYGISDFGLAKDLDISRKEAGEYIETYFHRYPDVKTFMEDMVKEAHRTGYVTTMFGRRRMLPMISSRNFTQRSLAERMAMNTPIQGTAADIIKLAMIRTDRELRQHGLKSRMLLQVHDELVLEVVKDEKALVTEILKETMEQVVSLKVPLVIDIHSGKNWAEAK